VFGSTRRKQITTKPPNPKSKTCSLIVRAKPEWEIEIRAFKEICARNGIQYSEELMRRGVRPFLQEHNWPPGNSQTVLPSYGAIVKLKCESCGEMFDHLFRAKFVSGLVADYCKACLEREQAKTTVKKVLGVV